ncbi:hypothetical protein G6F60_015370 [Rhizopus arrhizus]|nr:hypothetical protein G6F60_015370 [Rhizopus arrhizus]
MAKHILPIMAALALAVTLSASAAAGTEEFPDAANAGAQGRRLGRRPVTDGGRRPEDRAHRRQPDAPAAPADPAQWRCAGGGRQRPR